MERSKNAPQGPRFIVSIDASESINQFVTMFHTNEVECSFEVQLDIVLRATDPIQEMRYQGKKVLPRSGRYHFHVSKRTSVDHTAQQLNFPRLISKELIHIRIFPSISWLTLVLANQKQTEAFFPS